MLLPYFIPWKDRPVKLTSDERIKYESDIVFVGHYENDARVDYIRSLCESGLKVKIWSSNNWPRQVLGNLYDELAPIKPAYGDDYVKVLNGAKNMPFFSVSA